MLKGVIKRNVMAKESNLALGIQNFWVFVTYAQIFTRLKYSGAMVENNFD